MMADRMRTRFREVAEIQARAVGNVGSVKDKLQTVAYLPIIFMQMLVDIPTWLGAYNRALSDGNTDARAVAMADRTVIEAQGSGRLMDLSGVERGGAWSKLFTVFYTFFNTAYNIGMVTRKTDSALRAAFNMMLVMVLQPVVETFVREGLKASAAAKTTMMNGSPRRSERRREIRLASISGFWWGFGRYRIPSEQSLAAEHLLATRALAVCAKLPTRSAWCSR